MTPHASYMLELIKNIKSLFQSFSSFFSVNRLNKIRLSLSLSLSLVTFWIRITSFDHLIFFSLSIDYSSFPIPIESKSLALFI